MKPETLGAMVAAGAQLRQATVVRVEGDGTTVVQTSPREDEMLCETLQTSGVAPLLLAPDDAVLVWQPDVNLTHGVILGRIGLSHAADQLPDEIVLAAGRSLTIKCGAGAITIRADGKVLVKGKDLVSHAERMNRIKGGAVAIN